MVFNSLSFALFSPSVCALYWAFGTHRLRVQNAFILAASYLFYGFWDARFLSLIIVSSLVDFLLGQAIYNSQSSKTRGRLLFLSCLTNLGMLGVFKYFNFFVESAREAFTLLGLTVPNLSLEIVLPVGISFYTFQTLSYTIDIYRGQLKPERDPVAFFAFVSFFPQLVAGPIERAKDLLPQFTQPRSFDSNTSSEGLRQMLFGLLKKVVIADNLAPVVEASFSNYGALDGVSLALAAFLFAIQLYCDFSGYSDMAIGMAKLLGIRLSRNFAYPYFAQTMREFWRRWHISLSTWFRDYLYIPLGGVRVKTYRAAQNVVVVFVVSGLWHGASWNFIIWGSLNGLYTLPALLLRKRSPKDGDFEHRLLPSPGQLFRMVRAVTLWSFSLIFFRADTVTDSFGYIEQMLSAPWNTALDHSQYWLMTGVGLSLIVFEWFNRSGSHALSIGHLPRPIRWFMYCACSLLIFVFGAVNGRDFVYFQF